MPDEAEKQAKSTRPGKGGNHPPVDRRWKPGQSGNPKGRPKGTGITDRIEKALEENEGRVADGFAKAAIKHAMKGDFRFFQEIMNRLEGPVEIRHAGSDGEPLQVVFRMEKKPIDDS